MTEAADLKDPIVIHPSYVGFRVGIMGEEEAIGGVDTAEELVRQAESEARERGWKRPLRGTFIIRGEDGRVRGEDGRIRKVVIEPLTLENLEILAITLERVELVIIDECTAVRDAVGE